MLPLVHPAPLAMGPFTSPPALVGTLIVLLLVILVGRFVLEVAWKLVLIALGIVVVLWVLGAIGTGGLLG